MRTLTNRRAHDRIPVSWPVRFLLDDTRLLGRALDVSEEGLCVLTAPTDALKPGRSYHLLMVLSRSQTISCTAEVRHVTDGLVGLRTQERFRFT